MGAWLDIIDNYIKLKELQIKHTPFEIIELGIGKLVKEEEHSAILDFTIDQYKIDTFCRSSEKLLIDIDGEKHKCEVLGLSKDHITLTVHGYSGVHNDAKLLIDMSFIFKKQKEVLEEFKSDKHCILRGQLFGNYEIKGGDSTELNNRNEPLNELQNKAVSIALGVKDLFLIWGPPGTGKTTIVPEITKNYCDLWKKDNTRPRILICAWTNTAIDNVVKKLYKENYNIIRYKNGVIIRYGKGTTLNKDTYKEVLYDVQEKECRDRIEKEYASKLRPLESAKKDISEKIKEYENKIATIQNKTSELKTESSKLVKELRGQIDLDIEELKDSLKFIFEIELSKRQKQIYAYSNELDNIRVEHENTIKFIEELAKTIRRYEVDINNFKNENNKLNESKAELQHNLDIAKGYLFFIKQSKLKYLAYLAGVYSPSYLNDLIKYGLHKKRADAVILCIEAVEQKLIFLEGKLNEVIFVSTSN